MRQYKQNIPRLYSDLNNLNGNGLGFLRDVISCIVKEERNGMFEVEIEYKRDGFLSNELKTGLIICANASKKLRNQYFRIYDIKKDIADNIFIYAEHISFDLRVNSLLKLDMEGNCKAIMDAILENSVNETPFRMFSDITTSNKYQSELKSTYEALNELHNLFKPSDVLRDNFKYSILRDRGEDKNTLIAYKKNITGFKCTENKDNLCTRIIPYVKKDIELETTNTSDNITGQEQAEFNKETVYIPGLKVDAPNINNFDIQYTKVVDFSNDKFWDKYEKTAENLRILTANYFKENKTYIPSMSYEINLIALAETNEYKNMSFLEDIELCDTVIVKNSLYNISCKVKVTEIEFDVLQNKVLSVKLGDESTTLKTIMTDKAEEAIKKTEASKTELQQVIEHITNQITGNDGGYVKLYPPHNPSEIFILDNEDPLKATKVLRINKSGIGFGNNINGPFKTGWSCDGVFNADFIKTGSLSADLIKAGTLSNVDGSLKINLNGKSVDFYTLYEGVLKRTVKIEGSDISFYDTRNGNKAGSLAIKRIVGSNEELGYYPLIDLSNEVGGYVGISYKLNDGSDTYKFYSIFDAYNRSGIMNGYPVMFTTNMNIKGNIATTGVRIREGDTAILYHSNAGKTVLKGSPVANLVLADKNANTMLDFQDSGAIVTGNNYFFSNIKLNQAGTSKVVLGNDGVAQTYGTSGASLGDSNKRHFLTSQTENVSFKNLNMNGNSIVNANMTMQYANINNRSYTETYMAQSLQEEISYSFEATTKNGELRIKVNPNLNIETKDDYMVQLTVYDNCNIWCKKFDNHFIIYTGNDEVDFSCRVIVKAKNITPYKINNYIDPLYENKEDEVEVVDKIDDYVNDIDYSMYTFKTEDNNEKNN